MGNQVARFLWNEETDFAAQSDRSTRDVELNSSDFSFFSRSPKRPFPFKAKEKGDEEEKPAKVIKLDTAKYLHQKLFVEGKKSDVTIDALGHEWHLHKIYLEQCDYFRCLFSGNWVDSTENRYTLTISDERITYEGLNAVFASLYQNEIKFELKDLGGILAAATLFNLQVCIERCEELLLQSINRETIIEFLELSQCYGCLTAQKQCISYLSRFFWKLAQEDEFLAKLSCDLMVLIYSQPKLCVVDGERDLYNAVKRWIYIQDTRKIGRSKDEIMKHFVAQPKRYCYKYKSLLENIRFQHLINTNRTLKTLKLEHIIGAEIFNSLISDQWSTYLVNEEEALLEDTITDEYFYTHCRRVGRVLSEDAGWRWTGLNFGLDLVMRCQFGMVSITRNVSNDSVTQSLSMRKDYKIHYQLIVLNSKGDVVVDTQRKVFDLSVNQKKFVASYPNELKDYSVHLFYLNHVPGKAARDHWSKNGE